MLTLTQLGVIYGSELLHSAPRSFCSEVSSLAKPPQATELLLPSSAARSVSLRINLPVREEAIFYCSLTKVAHSPRHSKQRL